MLLMSMMTLYTPILICAAKFENFAEMKHPSMLLIAY